MSTVYWEKTRDWIANTIIPRGRWDGGDPLRRKNREFEGTSSDLGIKSESISKNNRESTMLKATG